MPIPVAERSKVRVRPIACWGCGFHSHWGHGCFCCVVKAKEQTRTIKKKSTENVQREGIQKNKNPGGVIFSAPVQTGPGTQLVSDTIRTGSLFRGLKQLGHGVNHPPPPSAEVKERVEVYLYSFSWPSLTVLR